MKVKRERYSEICQYIWGDFKTWFKSCPNKHDIRNCLLFSCVGNKFEYEDKAADVYYLLDKIDNNELMFKVMDLCEKEDYNAINRIIKIMKINDIEM